MAEDCKRLISHINRIQGQLNTLKDYLSDVEDCNKVVDLSLSVDKSFDTFKANLFESFIEREFISKGKLEEGDMVYVKNLLRFVKK